MMTEDCLSDFKWCIENDFQVYVKPINYSSQFKIAIRKGGITTSGKDSFYCKIKQTTIYSSETLGSKLYKNQKLAMKVLPSVYKYLRETYGI